MKSVADLERGLPLGAASRQVAASDTATALEATASNVYDFLMRVAASLSKVQERLAEAKESLLADRAAVSAVLWPCPASTRRYDAYGAGTVLCMALPRQVLLP